jgi:hypothetical protein
LLRQAQEAFDDADAAQADGDTVRWAELIEQAEEYVADAVALADEQDAGSGEDTTEAPTDEPTEEPGATE